MSFGLLQGKRIACRFAVNWKLGVFTLEVKSHGGTTQDPNDYISK
jgi:hypothetical protein